MFDQYFTLTGSTPAGGRSLLEELLPKGRVSRPGIYNNGTLAVLRTEDGRSLLSSWSTIVEKDWAALMTTGLGDVFVWTGAAVQFLDVQRGELEFVDKDPAWVLDEFLIKSPVLQNVLREDLVLSLQERLRALAYHEAFILEPWRMLGGDEGVGNYTIGDCAVYLSLVGQTLSGGTNASS